MNRAAIFFAALLLLPVAARAAPPAGTTAAPAAVSKPCPMHGMTGCPCAMHCPCAGGMACDCGKDCPCGGMPGMSGMKPPADAGTPPMYGWQLMTPQERAAYRAKLKGAKSASERAAIRAEHHQEMLERAKQQGVTLPDNPSP